MFCVERVPADSRDRAYKYKLKFWALDGALNACWGGGNSRLVEKARLTL